MSHLPVRGKTEQRVTAVLNYLRDHAGSPVTYDELGEHTNTAYDVLLYMLTTLCELGLVERQDLPSGPGRPKVTFTWIAESKARKTPRAQAVGA